jgi:hypothetical protein
LVIPGGNNPVIDVTFWLISGDGCLSGSRIEVTGPSVDQGSMRQKL